MCGCYYVDDDTAKEIERLVGAVDAQIKGGEIRPTNTAPVLRTEQGRLLCEQQQWGFPSRRQIINARSETALERPMFRDSVRRRRLAIPVAWFYEWSGEKEKVAFYKNGQPLLFLAGFYNWFQEEAHFVILTTAANASVKPVHDRMPLVLEQAMLMPWLTEDSSTERLLQYQPEALAWRSAYKQLTLF